jgi:hypothetical protein
VVGARLDQGHGLIGGMVDTTRLVTEWNTGRMLIRGEGATTCSGEEARA